jgi:hypothetical protein
MALVRNISTKSGSASWQRSRLAHFAGATALGTLFVTALVVSPAGAGSTGSFSLTGEVVANVKTSAMFNNSETVGGTKVTVPIHGCQVGQQGTNSDVINIPAGKVTLNGRSVKATAIQFNVPTDGKTDSLSPTSSQLTFGLNVGKLDYLWVSTAGTLTTKANGKSGSFSVTLAPSQPGVSSGGDKATSDVHIKGSWSSCTPWP